MLLAVRYTTFKPIKKRILFPFLVSVFLGLVNLNVLAQNPVSGDSAIVIPDSRVQLLFDGAFFTEGPAVAPDGTIYFSDITVTSATDMEAGHIWRFDPATDEASIYRSPSGMANGIEFDLEGRMVVTEGADFGGRRITRTDLETGRSEILVGLVNGSPLNAPNDLTIDEAGNIYFTDPRYFGHEPVEQPVEGVYRVDSVGTVSLIIADAGKPNGIQVSPDQNTLYVASLDNGSLGFLPNGMRGHRGRHALLAYNLHDDGSATFREEVIDFSSGRGPDGIAVDVVGNLYVTQPIGVTVYSPEGEQWAVIPVPELARNVTFGRAEKKHILYITAGGSLYQIQVKQAGYHPWTSN